MRWTVALLLVACTEATPPPQPPVSKPAPPALTALADGWHREAEPEPSPAAKGLYRRALTLAQRGDRPGATTLARQIRAQHPESRYAARLEPGGASAAATVAAAAAILATVLAKAAAPR